MVSWIVLDTPSIISSILTLTPERPFFASNPWSNFFRTPKGPGILAGVSLVFDFQPRNLLNTYTNCTRSYIDSVLKLWVINFLWFCLHKYAPKLFITNQHTHNSWSINLCFLFFGVFVQLSLWKLWQNSPCLNFHPIPEALRCTQQWCVYVCIVYSGTVWTISL